MAKIGPDEDRLTKLTLQVRDLFTKLMLSAHGLLKEDQAHLCAVVDAEVETFKRFLLGPAPAPPIVKQRGLVDTPSSRRGQRINKTVKQSQRPSTDVAQGKTSSKVKPSGSSPQFPVKRGTAASKRPVKQVSRKMRAGLQRAAELGLNPRNVSFEENGKNSRATAMHLLKKYLALHFRTTNSRIELTESLKDLGLQVARDLIAKDGSLEEELFYTTLSSISEFEPFKGSISRDEEKQPDNSNPSRIPITRPPADGSGVKLLTGSSGDKATFKKRFARAKKETRELLMGVKEWREHFTDASSRMIKEIPVNSIDRISALHFAHLYNSIVKLQNCAERVKLKVPPELPNRVPQEFEVWWVKKGLKLFSQPAEQGGYTFLNLSNPNTNQALDTDSSGFEFLKNPVPLEFWQLLKSCQEVDMDWVEVSTEE
jgi:hypothetical protein